MNWEMKKFQWALGGVALASLLAVIAVLASNMGVPSSQYAQVKAQLATTQQKLAGSDLRASAAEGKAIGLQDLLTQTQQAARNAQAVADAKAKAKYASMMAQAQSALTSAKQQQNAIATEAGQLQASQISASGVYVVGSDIKAGTWHTPGNGGNDPLSECYFAQLNSTNTLDIADNNNFNGPETVTLSGGAFEINGGCSWYKVS